jgi:hypothetical protein
MITKTKAIAIKGADEDEDGGGAALRRLAGVTGRRAGFIGFLGLMVLSLFLFVCKMGGQSGVLMNAISFRKLPRDSSRIAA